MCALLAAVTVAVEPPGQPAGAAASDQSGGSQDPPATPTTSAAAPTTSASPETASVDPPGAPSGFTASFSLVGGSVSLGWDNPGDATITKYQYRIRDVDAGGDYGDAWTDIPGSSASMVTYAITVTGSGRRNVQLRAVNAGGSGSHAVASTDVPDAPSRLRASLSGSSVSLSWDDPGDGSIDSYWYRIKKAGAGNAYSLPIEISGSGASTTSATISVTGEGRRIVELQARPAIHPGWGARYKSAVASTGRPAVPLNLVSPGGSSSGSGRDVTWTAAASSPKGSVTVSWDDPGDDSIVKYQYKLRPAGGSYSQLIDIPGSGPSTTSHTFVLPTPERYRIMLHAVNSEGRSTKRFRVEPSWPAPAAPTGFRASLSGGSLSLSWDNPFDDSIQKYEYRVKTVGAGNSYSDWVDITSSISSRRVVEQFGTVTFEGVRLSATINNVTGSERRVVQLRALHKIGNPSNPAVASTGRPAVPLNLVSPGGSSSGSGRDVTWTAAASSPKGSVTVSWDDPGDDSIVKYQYKLRPAGGSYSQLIDIPGSGPSTTSHTFVLPTPERYRIMLHAVNSEGRSTKRFRVEPSWPAPAAPTGFRASLSGGSLSLSWDNPFDDSIQKYEYRVKTVGAGNSYSDWVDITSSISSRRVVEQFGTVTFEGVRLSATINNVTGSGRRVVQLRALHKIGDPSNPAIASTE